MPDATSMYIRGWMQMVFYYHIIYSLETDIKVRHWSQLQILCTIIKDPWFTTSHTLCMMSSWCRIEPVCLSSWLPHGCLVSSTVADQLLILLPTGRARPPLRPPTHGDSISLRVHALPHSPVQYITLSITEQQFLYISVLLKGTSYANLQWRAGK